MLQGARRLRSTTPYSPTRLWILMATDLMAMIWMQAVGPWLDHTSRLTATATLGGHHLVVLAIAGAGFAMLVVVALLTNGFTETSPRLTFATNVACILSVVALTGLIAFVLAALLSRLLFGRFRP